jgi:hypothetical protein
LSLNLKQTLPTMSARTTAAPADGRVAAQTGSLKYTASKWVM